MASRNGLGTIAETVEWITATARARGWHVRAFGRLDHKVTLELAEPGHRYRGLLDVKISRSGLVQVRNLGSRNVLVATIVLVLLAILALLIAAGAAFAFLWSAPGHGRAYSFCSRLPVSESWLWPRYRCGDLRVGARMLNWIR